MLAVEQLIKLVISLIIIILLFIVVSPILFDTLKKSRYESEARQILTKIRECNGKCEIPLPDHLDLIYFPNIKKLCVSEYEETEIEYLPIKYETILCKDLAYFRVEEIRVDSRDYYIDYKLYLNPGDISSTRLLGNYWGIPWWEIELYYNRFKDNFEEASYPLRIYVKKECKVETRASYQRRAINALNCKSYLYFPGNRKIRIFKEKRDISIDIVGEHSEKEIDVIWVFS